jgi:group I intron endonuclease
MTGIYFIKNLVNQKIYIGLSTNIEARFLFHRRRLLSNTHKNEHFQSAFIQYGVDSFEFGILEECTEEQLSNKEKFWIAKYQSYDRSFGYNKTYGGEFGRLSDEIVQRTASKLRLVKHTQEMKDKISKTLTGRRRPKDEIEKAARACRKCSDIQEAEIVDLYINKGLTKKQIAIQLNIKNTLVVSILRRRGVTKNDKK